MRRVTIPRHVVCRLGLMSLPLMFGTFIAGCSDSFGPRWVDRVTIEPDSAHLEVGESVTFVATARDQNGNAMASDWPQFVAWNPVGSDVLALETSEDGQLTVTGLREGGGSVTGSLGRASPSFRVWVRPPGLDQIELSASPPVVSAYHNTRLSVVLKDTAGVVMNPARFRISWSVSDTSLVTVFFPFRDLEVVNVRGSGRTGDTFPRQGQTTLSVLVNGIRQSFDLTVTAQPIGPTTAPRVSTKGSAELEIVWDRNSQARGGYRVARSSSPQGPFAEVRQTPAGTFASFDTVWVDTGVVPASTYFYQIQACNQWGCALNPSPVGSGTTSDKAGSMVLGYLR